MSSELQSGHSERNGLVNSAYMNERISQTDSSTTFHNFRNQEHPEAGAGTREYPPPANSCSNYGVNGYEYPNGSSTMTISHYDEEYHRGNGSETPSVSEATAGHVYAGAAGLTPHHHPAEHGAIPHPAHHPEGVENIAPPGHFQAHHPPGLDQLPQEHRLHWLQHEHPENLQQFHFQQHFHEHFPFQGPFPGGFPPQIIIGPNGKPKRRRVATLAQRRAANIRERRRMFNLNEAFDDLRKKVPTFAYEKRLSRIETLRLAITYISFMADLVEGKDPKDIKLASVTKSPPWGSAAGLRRPDSDGEEEGPGSSKHSDDAESQHADSNDIEIENDT